MRGNHEQSRLETVKVVKEPIYGCRGCTCTCGVHQVDGILCRHAVAVAKSGRGEGMNLVNGMPHWWTTDCWKDQFPTQLVSRGCMSINLMKESYEENNSVFFVPDFAAPRKKGRPKNINRHKSALEVALKKSKGESIGIAKPMLTESELLQIGQNGNDDENNDAGRN